AFVVSSRHEAQCMVALEAAACGVPVVGTHVGVIPELGRPTARVGDAIALAELLAASLASLDATPTMTAAGAPQRTGAPSGARSTRGPGDPFGAGRLGPSAYPELQHHPPMSAEATLELVRAGFGLEACTERFRALYAAI